MPHEAKTQGTTHIAHNPLNAQGTLVCLPGVNSGAYLFTEALQHFPNWRVILLNPPGTAGVPLPLPFTVGAYARHTANLLTKLNIRGPITLLGHSLGGYTAQEFTRQNPSMVERLILVSTSRGQPDTTADISAMQASTGQSLWQLMQQTNQTPQSMLKHLFGTRFLHTNPESFQNFLAARQAHLPPTSVSLAHFTAGGAFTSLPWVHQLQVPTLVIHGTIDVLVTITSGKKLAQNLPQAHLLELFDVGHFPMLEHEHFWQFVCQFAHGQPVGMPSSQPMPLLQKLWQKTKNLFHPHA